MPGHNGAFFLLDNFDFTNDFDVPRPTPLARYEPLFPLKIADAYQFFLNLGSLKNANASQYFNGRARIWNEYLQHDTYDAYWQARNSRPSLSNIKPAVLVVGRLVRCRGPVRGPAHLPGHRTAKPPGHQPPRDGPLDPRRLEPPRLEPVWPPALRPKHRRILPPAARNAVFLIFT